MSETERENGEEKEKRKKKIMAHLGVYFYLGQVLYHRFRAALPPVRCRSLSILVLSI